MSEFSTYVFHFVMAVLHVDWDQTYKSPKSMSKAMPSISSRAHHREKTRGIILESLCVITENHTQITRVRFSV